MRSNYIQIIQGFDLDLDEKKAFREVQDCIDAMICFMDGKRYTDDLKQIVKEAKETFDTLCAKLNVGIDD